MKIVPENYFEGPYQDAYSAALSANSQDLGRLIEKERIDLNRPGKEDMTLLALACIRGDAKAISTLVDAGANPNQIIAKAGSPAVLAISRHFTPPSLDAIGPLLASGYDPNTRFSGTPWLFYMVDYRHWSGLYYAIHHGGNLNIQTDWGKSLLTYVAERGEYAEVKKLMTMGADPSPVAENGDSVLQTIEFEITRTTPGTQKWRTLVELRGQVLAAIPNPALRVTAFSKAAHEKIAQASDS